MSDDNVVVGKLDLTRIGGLLFDIDGTLSDTDDHLVYRITRGLTPLTFLFKNKNSRRFARWFVMAVETPANYFYGLADKLGLDRSLSGLYRRILKKRHRTKPAHERFWIIPGVKIMLERFSEKYPMAVVSSRDAESTAHFLEMFDLMPYFNCVVTAQTCDKTKPFPDPVLFAAEQLGIDPSRCVMIGDTVVDIRAGKSAGTQTVAVLCGFGTQRELQRAGADLIISNTADLENFLAESRNNDAGT